MVAWLLEDMAANRADASTAAVYDRSNAAAEVHVVVSLTPTTFRVGSLVGPQTQARCKCAIGRIKDAPRCT